MIPKGSTDWVIIDEVQKIPELLDEVHRIMEEKKHKFILTGSSARKLKRKGINLLAGRALTKYMHPLTVDELGSDFSFYKTLKTGFLPASINSADSRAFLLSYVETYLREEVLLEGLTRNISAFSRFLEAASFSQAEVLNISEVARESHQDRKLTSAYFSILEDLLIARRIECFAKRAKREIIAHPKFFFFDVGVFQAIRPRGPLDSDDLIGGAALETVFFQQAVALNDYENLGYKFYYWRTKKGLEVDFVLYGERGLKAIEIKRSHTLRGEDFKGLKAFSKIYPEAQSFILYGGHEVRTIDNVLCVPIDIFIRDLKSYL
jgi:predicted AAA+ superfamily ATPase